MKTKKKMEKLQKVRGERHFSQAKLAEMVGVDKMTIYHYEAGARRPNMDMLKKLANALECTVDEII